MKKGILLCLMMFCLCGCSLAVKEISKVDQSLYDLMTSSKLTLDCKAGIANGFIIAPDSNAAVRSTAVALQGVANKESPDYRNCFGQAVWISFLIHGSKDLGNKIIEEIAKIPVMIAPLGSTKPEGEKK
jgi:hypothetical protein